MESITTFNTIKQYCAFNNQGVQHPQISVVDLSLAHPRTLRRMQFNFYVVFLKEVRCGDLRYGCGTYDYEEGTLVFIAPGQVIGQAGEEVYQPVGQALVFHPDFLLGTPLAGNMEEYSFFAYEANEALHLSEKERALIDDGLGKIRNELERLIDKHTKRLLISNLQLFLNYCVRFYDRQFITRSNVNQGVLAKFEALLNGYFRSGLAEETGLPAVSYFADQLHLSANYFGDLVKKETGKSPQDHLQLKLITVAKEQLFDPNKSIAEVAYGLGFKYPQHFTRLFKKIVGVTPGEFRAVG
ncbi:helix-turn-helix transcriptional regulator [Neolewinella lacunae]|uniref:Helix-turn-helix transcriptional regulator n=1 Tax=Neolewinella lacunae TaxID=1517758 RepID=A0A923PJK0_9BACT|nr:helix-turn-helix transcriptional regulator [Neolewinella lacunae]MBC6993740.1 helix-turn-helix transcriptional regulator [Neolewinella lacunae]MDN3635259.1 helix-turn-helix transcriptional regulator [Neolewinella lacunae]